VEQVSCTDEAAVLQADPARRQWAGGVIGGRCVAELWVVVVHRRWPRAVHRAPISGRYLTQDDRIEIADGLAASEAVKAIAARIGKSYQTVYREIARNRKADGRYQPWFAHNQAYLRRRRPKLRRLATDAALRAAVARKLEHRWSPRQISRWLRRRWPRRRSWHLSVETIYDAVYRGLVVVTDRQTLRTGRTYRHRRGRGRTREGALKQSTNMKSIHDQPEIVEARSQIGHWEGDCATRGRTSGVNSPTGGSLVMV
jgi:transposase, IS30 family